MKKLDQKQALMIYLEIFKWNLITVLEFLKLLIKKSITPEDDGCQDLIDSFLKPLGFNRRVMNFNNVKNSIYSNTTSGKSICF